MKKLMYLQRGLIAAAAISLAGCSVFGDDEITYKELQPFTPSANASVSWSASAGNGVGEFFSRLNPVVVDNLVVVADREGKLMAFDRETQKRVWQKDLQTDYAVKGEGWFAGHESLRISGGLSAYQGRIALGTENGDVFVLNANDGSLLWHAQVNAEVIADPAMDASFVVAAASNGELIGLDADSGEEQWRIVTDVPALSLRGTSAPAIASVALFLVPPTVS